MEILLGGQPDAAGTKLPISTLVSARSIGQNPRNGTIVVRMGHGAVREPPHSWNEAVQVRVLDDMVWETQYQNTRQK